MIASMAIHFPHHLVYLVQSPYTPYRFSSLRPPKLIPSSKTTTDHISQEEKSEMSRFTLCPLLRASQ